MNSYNQAIPPLIVASINGLLKTQPEQNQPDSIPLPSSCCKAIELAHLITNKAKTDQVIKCFKELETPGNTQKLTVVQYLHNNHAETDAEEIFQAINYDALPSDQRKLQYAVLLARFESPEAGEKLVHDLYADNTNLKDGYARIGWRSYWPKKEYDKVIEFCELDKKQERLSPAWMINFAVAYAATGDFNQARSLVERAYKESPHLKDGYSRISWQCYLPLRDYRSVRLWMKRDADANRLSPAWSINQAKVVALTDGIEAALPLVKRAYKTLPNLKNAYSQVAWAKFVAHDMTYEKVIPYFEKDQQLKCLQDEWLLVKAQALAVIGQINEAEQLISKIYQRSPEIYNGYAGIGLSRHILLNFSPKEAIPYFEYDQKKERLRGACRIHYAAALAASGDLSKALNQVEEAYRNDASIHNGYATIAWHYYVRLENDLQSALRLFEKDIQMNRLRLVGWCLLAGLHALRRDKRSVDQVIHQNSEEIKRTGGGVHVVIGFCDYRKTRDLDYLAAMFERDDIESRRYSLLIKYLHAAVMLKCGHTEKAHQLVKAVAQRSRLTKSFAKSWFERIAFASPENIHEFLTPQLREWFNYYS
ncbi:MAG: hypothetical protein DRP42_06090 [Tenericutes bacterium]|nr:MAG: hypothetical protein DRP42_06090 [Mycoplasmatota bacterium]